MYVSPFLSFVLPGGNFRDFVNRGEQMGRTLHNFPNSEYFQIIFSTIFPNHFSVGIFP
nr:MAG TPA: hypothetical protein [Caudoviricetes sp.]